MLVVKMIIQVCFPIGLIHNKSIVFRKFLRFTIRENPWITSAGSFYFAPRHTSDPFSSDTYNRPAAAARPSQTGSPLQQVGGQPTIVPQGRLPPKKVGRAQGVTPADPTNHWPYQLAFRELPWRRVQPVKDLTFRSPPHAPEAVERGNPLPWGRRLMVADQEVVPYATAPLPGLAVAVEAIESIEEIVEQKVKAEVTRQQAEIASTAPGGDAAVSRVTAADIANDEIVQTIMKKIGALAREQRFRSGQLR